MDLSGSVYPRNTYTVEDGLTKREYVATAMFAAMIARGGSLSVDGDMIALREARIAVTLADTLLKVCNDGA